MENIILAEKDSCTGCMACYNKCPHRAIKIVRDSEGFLFPEINHDHCVSCGSCVKACPILTALPKKKNVAKKVYALWTKDVLVRIKSSSGGLFYEVAKYVLENKGVVVGAAYNEDFSVSHKCIERLDELPSLMGSKYVQSSIGLIYREIKHFLQEKRLVLCSGTPCQIAGLYAYLGREYDNLLTMDLVCHGVPSPQVFKSYLLHLENKYASSVVSFTFRDKHWSWARFNTKANFSNGKIYYGKWEEDVYMRGFLREYFLRKSCHQCRFACIERLGDITMADYWGYVSDKDELQDEDKGVSMAIVNTQKGVGIYSTVSHRLNTYERTLKNAMRGNQALSRCFQESPLRKDFWELYKAEGFSNSLITQYLYAEPIEYRGYRILYKYGKDSLMYKCFLFLRTIKNYLK